MATRSSSPRSGGTGALSRPRPEVAPTPDANSAITSAGMGAQARPKYYDRHEEYVLVTKDDLREISSVGWLQEGAAAVGLFFVSGAFWLLMTLLAEHGKNKEFYAWYLACLVIMVCGGVVMWVGVSLYRLKQRRIDKYFPDQTDA